MQEDKESKELSLVNSNRITDDQKKYLLEERENLIQTNIDKIQNSFFLIGKALFEIKQYKLYKADPIYNKWKDFVKYRILSKLHQSTISDYMAIVKMQIENQDFMGENELITLGYKKAKLLKSKFNMIKKIKNNSTKNKLKQKFIETYKMSFDELNDVPFSIYEKKFNFIKTEFPQNITKEEFEKDGIKYILDKKNKKIIIKSNSSDNLKQLFDKLKY